MKEPKKPKSQIVIQTLEETIKKTGFVLEHLVASKLEKAKWNVIHNRYYLDDVTQLQREMDLLAYKVSHLKNDVRLVTALIISCKKNEEFDWVFLTRKAPGMNPNVNMLPISFSSNIDTFNFQLQRTDWSKDKFIDINGSTSLIDKLYNYERIVFAYQEIRKTNNAPSNDSNIYSSVASLIKAQAYEITSLKERRGKEKYIYNINLLSVSDLDFFELHYEGLKVTQTSIERINYLNRFLINNSEQHAKIEFIKFKALDEAIKDYNDLHLWNQTFFETKEEIFYDTIWRDLDKLQFIIEREKASFLLRLKILNRVGTKSGIENDFKFLYLKLENKKVLINVSDSQDENNLLNSNKTITRITKEWLKMHFRYEGDFIYQEDDDLPF